MFFRNLPIPLSDSDAAPVDDSFVEAMYDTRADKYGDPFGYLAAPVDSWDENSDYCHSSRWQSSEDEYYSDNCCDSDMD